MLSKIILLTSFAMLALAVIGSLLPALPGPALSLAGTYLYWWNSGYVHPGPVLLTIITVMSFLALIADWIGPALISKFGDASKRTAFVTSVTGIIALFISGPIVMVGVIFVTAFLMEYYRQKSFGKGIKAAMAALIGTIGGRIFELLVTLFVFVSMLLVHFT
ncbi:MAG: DUF456 domain-containing protein [bacterium]